MTLEESVEDKNEEEEIVVVGCVRVEGSWVGSRRSRTRFHRPTASFVHGKAEEVIARSRWVETSISQQPQFFGGGKTPIRITRERFGWWWVVACSVKGYETEWGFLDDSVDKTRGIDDICRCRLDIINEFFLIKSRTTKKSTFFCVIDR